MPVTEYNPKFLEEVWSYYGIGTSVLFMRFAVRLRTVGIWGMQGDDFFSVLVLAFYTMDAWTVHRIYHLGTNVEANEISKKRPLTPHEISDYTKGSVNQLIAWYSYVTLIWCLKGTMLFFFSRITIEDWHIRFVKTISVLCVVTYTAVVLTITLSCYPPSKNYQVTPDPGQKCTFKRQDFLVTAILNIMQVASATPQPPSNPPSRTDTLILCIPLPLLWTLRVSRWKKIFITVLLSSGGFVVAAAIIRVVITLSGHPSSLTINGWGVRETIIGIVAVNMPIVRGLFTRRFWTSSAAAAARRSNTPRTRSDGDAAAGGRPKKITLYDLTGILTKGTTATRTMTGTTLTRTRGRDDSVGGGEEWSTGIVIRNTCEMSEDAGIARESPGHDMLTEPPAVANMV